MSELVERFSAKARMEAELVHGSFFVSEIDGNSFEYTDHESGNVYILDGIDGVVRNPRNGNITVPIHQRQENDETVFRGVVVLHEDDKIKRVYDDDEKPLLSRGTKRVVACRKSDFTELAWDNGYVDIVKDERNRASKIGTGALVTALSIGAGLALLIKGRKD